MAHMFSIKLLRHRHNRIGDAGAKRLARAIKVLEARDVQEMPCRMFQILYTNVYSNNLRLNGKGHTR